jgi:hypothetical protein
MENFILKRSKISALGILLIIVIGIMASQVNAQTPAQRARKETVDIFLFGREIAICTRKEANMQYLYVSRIDNHRSPVKDEILNNGEVNAIVGADADHTELYVYHRSALDGEKIVFYKFENETWITTGERALPAINNTSENLRLFLTEDKQKLVLSAQLTKTSGMDDIYVSEWSGKGWSSPKNLGKKVNTRLQESAMYLRGNTLYFSRQLFDEKYVFALDLKSPSKPQMIEEATQRTAFNANGSEARRDYARSESFEVVRIK